MAPLGVDLPQHPSRIMRSDVRTDPWFHEVLRADRDHGPLADRTDVLAVVPPLGSEKRPVQFVDGRVRRSLVLVELLAQPLHEFIHPVPPS
jgi:hypothetical protein